MNNDLAKIRREQWLQSKKLDNHEEEEQKKASPALHSQVWLDDLNSSNKKLKNDSASSSDNIAAEDGNMIQTSKLDAKKASNKAQNDCIDLTLSDSDDEVIAIDTRASGTRINRKQNTPTPIIQDMKMSSALASSSFSSSVTSSAKEKAMKSFSICTYNIWFGEPYQPQRMACIADLISGLSPKPTFLGLQEVTPGLLRDLSPLLQSMGYRINFQEGVSYGCAIGILTHDSTNSEAVVAQVLETGFHPYRSSQMARGLLWVHARLETIGEVLFTTTHLESYIQGNDGSSARERQILEASQFCLARMSKKISSGASDEIKAAFITGDLNWDDERKRSSGTDKMLLPVIQHNETGQSQWTDAWLETQQGKDGYTFDSKENPMLKGNLRRRFDRCLVSCRENKLITHTTELVGKEAIPGLRWRKEVQKWSYGKPTDQVSYDMRPLAPSDHFGLVVSFGDISNKPTQEEQPPSTKGKRAKKT